MRLLSPPRASWSPGRALRGLRDHDPGFARARVAAAVIVAAALGGSSAYAVLHVAGGPGKAAVLGGLTGMMGAMTTPPARAGLRAVHVARFALVAAAGAAAAAAVSPWPWAAYALFLAVIAGAAWATRGGPSWMGAGIGAFNACTLAVFLRATPAEAPWLAVAAALGGLGAAFVGLVLLPHRPAVLLRRLLPALDARIERLFETLLDALADGVDDAARDRVRALHARVQEVALQIDGVLDTLAGGGSAPGLDRLRTDVLWAEVLADHAAWSVISRGRGDLPPAPEEAARLAALWRAPPPDPDGPGLVIPLPDHACAGTTADVVGRLAVARRALRPVPAPAGTPNTRPGTAPAGPPGGVPTRPGSPSGAPPPTRAAAGRKVVQALLAGALAIALGNLLSPTYWEWAVMGAFLVILTTPFRGAAVRRAVDRTLGTLLGVVAGLALGAVLRGHASVELVLIVALLFLAFWIFQVSYTGMTLLMTVLVALLYDLLGRGPSVLLVRLYETALGATIGGLVAWFVLPAPSRTAIDGAVVAVLDALDALLVGLAENGRGPPAPLLERIRRLDAAVAAVRTLTQPLVTSVPVPIADVVREARLLATSTRFRARALATALERDGAPLVDEGTAEVLAAVRHRLHELRARIDPAHTAAALPAGNLRGGDGPVADILRGIDARLVAYLQFRPES